MRSLAALLLLALSPAAAAGKDALERAVEAELARSARMSQEGYPPPYFVSLTATDLLTEEERCHMGGSTFAASLRQRLVTPDIRVGSHELDNHPVGGGPSFVGASLPFTDDEFAVRHVLWRALDPGYKSAAAGFLRKQALRVRRGKAEYDTDDLSREPARARLLARPASPWSFESLRRLCREGSAAFAGEPGLLAADGSARLRRQWSRLWDTQGSRVDFGREFAEIELEASLLSSDGLRLSASKSWVAPVPAGLPSPEAVAAEARELIKDLRDLREAKSTAPFNAPALLDSSVSAAVVLSIAGRLSGEEQRNPGGAQTFRDQMGKPVLPPEFTLEDDPTLASLGGTALVGAYDYDDEGIPAQKVTLVDKGVLKGLLLSRYPVIGFPRSNGHGRAFPGHRPDGSPGVLLLKTSRPLSEKDLLERLRAECRRRGKSHGLWVKKLRGFSQNQGTGGQVSIRLLPGLLYLVEAETGALTLVRDLDAVGTPLALLSNIISAGADFEAHNLTAGEPVSVGTPSLLLSDAELQRAETRPEKPPVLAPPPAP